MTRQETERDVEAEAEFDRELAKMMSESIDSRKSDRKQMFDVPLPMRRAQRDTTTAADDSPSEGTATPPNTMAFSLMTKKGNRQQVINFKASVDVGLFTDCVYRPAPSISPQTPTLPSQ